jgi:thioredoxin reductase (NADPH)
MNYEWVENYPGFPEGIAASELGSRMLDQAMRYGVEFKLEEVRRIRIEEDCKVVQTQENEYSGRAVIIATGAQAKTLNKGENKFLGKGVFYCGTCEGNRFVNQTIAVIGGGDSGVTEALMLAEMASKVILIEAMPQLNASKTLKDRILAKSNVEVRCNSRIRAIDGQSQVELIHVSDTRTDEQESFDVNGVLIRIGFDPNTDFLPDSIALNENKQVVVNMAMETNVPGVFAIGDVRSGSPNQIASAVGDGVAAALSAEKFLMLKDK